MATSFTANVNGNLVNDPTCKEFENGGAVWNFTLALNAKDKDSKEDASIWIKFSYKASSDDEFMKSLKKKSCVMVSAKLPYMLNQYSASYTHEKGKHDMNLSLEAFGITRGTFDSKAPKSEGEETSESDDFYPAATKRDPLVPSDTKDEGFSIPVTKRGPSFS